MIGAGRAARRTAAPGWYASPGEEGLARFWDGRRWTEGRQPLPPPVDAVPVLPMTQPIATTGFTGYPGVAGPGALRPDRATATATADADADAPTFRLRLRGGEVLDVGAITGSRAGRAVSRASSVGAALFLLVFSGLWLVICFAFMKPAVWDAATPGAGEATATGVVVDQHGYVDDDGDRLCSPEATFTVAGEQYVAAAAGASSDCPAVGADVTVIYRVADPADSHVAPSGTMRMLFLLFPVVGFLVLGLALWMLFRSLGGAALVARLRARRLPDDDVGPAPTSPPVTWNP